MRVEIEPDRLQIQTEGVFLGIDSNSSPEEVLNVAFQFEADYMRRTYNGCVLDLMDGHSAGERYVSADLDPELTSAQLKFYKEEYPGLYETACSIADAIVYNPDKDRKPGYKYIGDISFLSGNPNDLELNLENAIKWKTLVRGKLPKGVNIGMYYEGPFAWGESTPSRRLVHLFVSKVEDESKRKAERSSRA